MVTEKAVTKHGKTRERRILPEQRVDIANRIQSCMVPHAKMFLREQTNKKNETPSVVEKGR